MTVSVNPLLSTNDTSGAGKTSSGANSAAFSALLSAELSQQLSGLGFGGAGQSEGLSSTESAAMLAQVPALLSAAGEEGGGLKSTVILFFMMMGSGASGSSMAAAMSSLSAALTNVSPDTAENLRFDVLNGLVSGGYDRAGLQRANDMVFGFSANEQVAPFSASKPANPTVTSREGSRSPGLYRSVIDQFQVQSSPRYAVNKKGNNDTYCNIFLWDVTRAMGAEIPHYVDPVTLEARAYPDVSGAKELNANGIYDWLGAKGADYGWVKVTPEQAQQYANQGLPVVTAWKNTQGGHGHVQVVCPSGDGLYDPSRGVTVAQAGRTLTNYTPITNIYSERLNSVVYYAHA
ncbi:MAG TPA: hypothetical protein VN366_00380 [Feifaniaceae bacterium]|nr:hypothetical protein [Feifaniaceae bacterium]